MNALNYHNNYDGITTQWNESVESNPEYKLFPIIPQNIWQIDEHRNSKNINDLKEEKSPLSKIHFENNCDSIRNSSVCFFFLVKK